MSAAPRRRRLKQGEKFRIVVSSAEEAVEAIREKYGEAARVLSVEQVGGKGLARFLSAPQLEVIGMVMSPEEVEREKTTRDRETAARREQQAQIETKPVPASAPVASNAQAAPALPQAPEAPAQKSPERPERGAGRPTRERPGRRGARTGGERPERPARGTRPVRGARPGRGQPQGDIAPEAPVATPTRPAPAAKPTAAVAQPAPAAVPADPRMREVDTPLTPSGKETLDTLLNKASFDDDLINRLAMTPEWDRISKMQLNHGLTEVFSWLRKEYQQLQPRPIATRMAFMGTPGCGKTTALCKRMATDVFVYGKQIQVLKVEGESPNPDDALRVLCDILGVSLYRDPIDLDKVNPDGELYVDVPGIPLHDEEQWGRLAQRLDELYVETRVMVINAAYEKDAIKEMLILADKLGCTHQVFTHLDELTNITKLWHFILNSNLTTLFFSHGQNVTSEFSADILEYMTNRTFPSYLTH